MFYVQCQQIQHAIDKASDPKLQNILQQLRGYPNIPRKKAKFEVCLTSLITSKPYFPQNTY